MYVKGMLRDHLKIIFNVTRTFLSLYIIVTSSITFCYCLIYGKNMTGQIGTSSRRKQRIENKKKKMAALLDIVKLNEYDRQKSKNKLQLPKENDCCENVETDQEFDPTPKKKLKTENIGLGRSGKPTLEGTEYLELKKRLREKTMCIKQVGDMDLDIGHNASLKVDMNSRCPLFLSDIQHLILYSQVGVHSPYSPARWCSLEKYNRLANVTILIIENISLYHYEAFESQFEFLKTNFPHKIEIVCPFSYNNDIVQELSMVPLSATQMKKLINEHGSLDEATKACGEVFNTVNNFFPVDHEENSSSSTQNDLPGNDKYPRTQLLLSGWQMIEENFPLPIKGLMERKYSDYILTKQKYKHVNAHSPMIAMDCEMCKTSTGDLELTRISIVNEKHEVIYDTLVKPENKIVDYLTRFSGINSKMLKNVTKKLKDVQKELIELLPDDAILVGQSLSNDLHALKMMHPYIIDTSVIYNVTGDRCRKTKLQTLAREFLDEKIQTGHQGHCSSEDSLACMKLTQLKLSKHLYFGDAVMNSIRTQQRAYPDIGSANYATGLLTQCIKGGNRVNVVAVDDIAEKYRFYTDKKQTVLNHITCVKKDSNKQVIEELCSTVNTNNLNIGHLRIATGLIADETPNREKVFKLLDKWIAKVSDAADKPSLIGVILSGQKGGGNGVCFLQLKREYII
ncbi:RNA exonuclease 5 isoform X2 [Rhynchophorus ferrugineus]|uniref:RNA exonuclease 5 isoform X2 n=1 Tax=Rhynchophorus ferrugineus TaxID=354439 RepID=UPI003FCC9626